MATGIVLEVVGKLCAALRSEELREVWSMLGYESQLDELAVTISNIKSVLLDAESKHQDLSHEGRHYIDRLKEAVYDVDDLLDEFNTVIQREKMKKGGKVLKKVRQFFSRSNDFLVAFNMSSEIKKLTTKLDKIAKDHRQFGLSDVHVPRRRRDATFSYTSDHSIIGREVDKESIVVMLMGESDSMNDVCGNVSFVSIIGMGGLGKTALAQLVYNENRIENTFDLRLWVCVSEDFTLGNIFSQILEKNGLQIEELQREVRKKIEGKKYLLILDDMWSENRDEWDKLKVFLDVGRKGSKILVTSRSRKVAKVLEDDLMYELKGLSEEDSWDLFKKFAFRKGQEPMNNDDHLFDISQEISKKCANVPLALRVVGSMLYDQDESKWLSVLQSANLANMGQGEEGILPILKFSYYELSSALKSCFSYCALFPKDYRLQKEKLIRLWLVHGCLDQPHDCRSKEDIGEEYFSTLLSRCLLQDVTVDEYGEFAYCRMHDLIHDLAQEVTGKETVMLDHSAGKLDMRNRHLSLSVEGCRLLGSSRGSKMKKLRTIIHVDLGNEFRFVSDVPAVCFRFKRLRVLDLSRSDLITLPDKVGNLSHLRYLDLSSNKDLRILPNSITKLYNLQVLNLTGTSMLWLPQDIRKLVNLRHLCFGYLFKQHMPAGFETLTNLRTLSQFVVGDETSTPGNEICKLTDLKALVNLRGKLTIEFSRKSKFTMEHYQDTELIRAMQLKKVCIRFKRGGVVPDTLLARLQPHKKLKDIEIEWYNGLGLPNWVDSLTTSLPNLVKIKLGGFRCEILPPLSQLRHLKCLELWGMPNVEFIERRVIVDRSNNESHFFPSLEVLKLESFPKLTGWWKEEINSVTGEAAGSSSAVVSPFPALLELCLSNCPSLTTLPSCPKLRDIELYQCHEALTLFENNRGLILSSSIPLLYMNKVSTDNVGMLDCLFGDSFGGISDLQISIFEGESFLTLADKCLDHACSITRLEISSCENLVSLAGVTKHYTSLKSLSIFCCNNLELENSELTVSPLESLHLFSLQKLVNLPNELKYLTTLQSLSIEHCLNLEALPEWIDCFTSLQILKIWKCEKLKSLPEAIGRIPTLKYLTIKDCENLQRSCRQPDGEDWAKVRHIPHLDVD